ncbi:hypothetical protein BDW66DRAFT_149554 [Aspergillus desertorum]
MADTVDFFPGSMPQNALVMRHLAHGFGPHAMWPNEKPILSFMTLLAAARRGARMLLYADGSTQTLVPTGQCKRRIDSRPRYREHHEADTSLSELLLAHAATLVSDVHFVAVSPRVRQGESKTAFCWTRAHPTAHGCLHGRAKYRQADAGGRCGSNGTNHLQYIPGNS